MKMRGKHGIWKYLELTVHGPALSPNSGIPYAVVCHIFHLGWKGRLLAALSGNFFTMFKMVHSEDGSVSATGAQLSVLPGDFEATPAAAKQIGDRLLMEKPRG